MSGLHLHGAALVTGAARGIGAAYAERLARRGRDLILVAGDRAALEDVARRLRPRGVRVELVVADLSRADDLAAVETQLRGDDRIGVLVNDAALGDGSDEHPGEATPRSRLRVDCGTATRLARAAAEGFVAQRYGTILNIALAADGHSGPASREERETLARLIEFSRALRDELRPYGVRVKACVHRLPRADFSRPRASLA